MAGKRAQGADPPRGTRSRPGSVRDLERLQGDLQAGALPEVSFIKFIGCRSEHPGKGVTLSAGFQATRSVLEALARSRFAADTLVLLAYDQGGGSFEHVPSPPPSAVDGQPYGARMPL